MKNILMMMTVAAMGRLISLAILSIKEIIEHIKFKKFVDSLLDEFIEEHIKILEEERHEAFETTTDEIKQHIEETENELRRFKENA